jgi:hypothetical protein
MVWSVEGQVVSSDKREQTVERTKYEDQNAEK